jgi:DNA-binding MarR family transcriptional regulator
MGLVDREGNPSDRRISRLVLTPKGTATADRIHRERDKYFTRVFSHIPKNRHNTVLEAFNLLVEARRRS